MTRVNAGIDPKELKRAHLIAEIREITMVPAALRRSLKTKTIVEVVSSIPKEFTLDTGHVKFFYNKLAYLERRFYQLAHEMERRGYHPDRTRAIAFLGFPSEFYHDWSPTERDNKIVEERIALRISQKPHLYKT